MVNSLLNRCFTNKRAELFAECLFKLWRVKKREVAERHGEAGGLKSDSDTITRLLHLCSAAALQVTSDAKAQTKHT